MNGHWPLYVKFNDDETITSWLIRIALRHGCDPLSLTGSVWPNWRVWTLDLDRGIPPEKMINLQTLARVDSSTLKSRSLYPIAERILGHPPPTNGIWKWLTALGIRNRSLRTGIQVCPMCLKEDKDPYLRRNWRFAWHTRCDKHKARLVDRCTNCSSTISPIQLRATDRNIAVCHSCKMPLHGGDVRSVSTSQNYLQKSLDGSLADRTSLLCDPSIELTTTQHFIVAEFYIALVRKFLRSPNSNIGKTLHHAGMYSAGIDPTRICTQLELLPADLRHTIMERTWTLMSVPLVTLFESFLKFGVTQNTIRGCMKNPPDVFLKLFEKLPQATPTKRPRNQSSKLPRSKSVVLKKWHRLKRKAGIRF